MLEACAYLAHLIDTGIYLLLVLSIVSIVFFATSVIYDQIKEILAPVGVESVKKLPLQRPKDVSFFQLVFADETPFEQVFQYFFGFSVPHFELLHHLWNFKKRSKVIQHFDNTIMPKVSFLPDIFA